jgi:hypothetical protein
MNIKSLLLGSAAALAVVSGAQAADAIVAAEPEPMEYVRVCDAFGTGYFYIPGTETCLKISGYVRAQIDMGSYDRGTGVDKYDWNARTRAKLQFDAKNDTDLGTLGSTIAIRTWADGDYNGGSVEIDEAYMTLGGFTAGYKYNYWDDGLSGETDDLGSNRINTIGYEYAADAFKVGVFLDELTDTYSTWAPVRNYYGSNDNVGIEAQVSAAFGPATFAILGGYDIAAENGAVRAIVEAEIGPGTLGVAGVYSTGANAYYDVAEWTLAGEYAIKLTDKLKLTPGAQYWWNYGAVDAAGDFTGSNEAWKAGLTLDYAITAGLTSKVSVQYMDADNGSGSTDNAWSGFFRLQRSF